MSGFIAMQRSALDHHLIGEPERFRAWFWLVAHACWKPTKVRIKGQTVTLERGQLSFSQRFMAEAWGWSKSRVDRFIADLRDEGMIETRSKNGATAGHPAGQGQAVITICNYDKYQDPEERNRGNAEPESGATAGQQRGKEEQGNKETINNSNGDYAFSGRVIRLTGSHYREWQDAYPDLDLRALLTGRDAWLAELPESKRKRWFVSTASWLANRQQDVKRREINERKEEVYEGP